MNGNKTGLDRICLGISMLIEKHCTQHTTTVIVPWRDTCNKQLIVLTINSARAGCVASYSLYRLITPLIGGFWEGLWGWGGELGCVPPQSSHARVIAPTFLSVLDQVHVVGV